MIKPYRLSDLSSTVIANLRIDAGSHGDTDLVRDCDTALDRVRDGAARKRIVAALNEAAARSGSNGHT